MPDAPLVLEVTDFSGVRNWRWVLKDGDGAFLSDHVVSLRPDEREYRALFDLPGYLYEYAAPDKRDEDEKRLMSGFGEWIRTRVLGNVADAIVDYGTPVVVRVTLPPEAAALLNLPLETAIVDGNPLALHDVSLVFEIAGENPRVRPKEIGERLRILAIFSVPPAASPLNLRRERKMLQTLVRDLMGTTGRAVDLRVLQYGTTRESLRDALEEDEGWDIIHFSGHGLPGSIALERLDGSHDLVASEEVAALLRLARGRLKLVTLSACLSGAATIDQTLSWLRIESAPHPEERVAAPAGSEPMSVARALVRTLDCSVLAMRYAVEDEFASTMTYELYRLLLEKGQPLTRALSRALSSTAARSPAMPVAALSFAAPALFGRRALDLRLVPPPAATNVIEPPWLAHFPDEPARFVGRVMAMTRASAAMARDARKSGVIFYGMAGGGKTSCALELAYHLAAVRRFRAFVWYRAPPEGADIALALRDFALAMEKQLALVLPGFAMVHVVDRAADLESWLPVLTEMLERTAILIVLDNVESLLSANGAWRDERWKLVLDALVRPGGLSRVVITSRIRPVSLGASVDEIAIHALPLDEAILLVQDLPNLNGLLNVTGTEAQFDGRELVRRTLRMVQGHPKLIELADGLAANPRTLAAQLDRAEATQSDTPLNAFFDEGTSRYDIGAFVTALAQWTTGVLGTLPLASRTLFHVLCGLEESDRLGAIVEYLWANIWKPQPPPDLSGAIATLLAAALVERRPDAQDDPYGITIHPGVAEAGRADAGNRLQGDIDRLMQVLWEGVMKRAATGDLGERTTNTIVRAGLSAFPYQSRCGAWAAAGEMLQAIASVDKSPATTAAVLLLMRRIAAGTEGTEDELHGKVLLATVLSRTDPAEARVLARDVIDRALAKQDDRTAAAACTTLMEIFMRSGRYLDALQTCDMILELRQRFETGPWTELAGAGRRLHLLGLLGRNGDVLEGLPALRARMAALPESSGPLESVNPWTVRESLLRMGQESAMKVQDWAQALELSGDLHRAMGARGAPPLEQARSRFHDYGAFLNLGRYDEATALLSECRIIGERENDVALLGMTFGALAQVHAKTGRLADAVQFTKTALRYNYVSGDPQLIATVHVNLAHELEAVSGNAGEIIAHYLASIMIDVLIGSKRGWWSDLFKYVQRGGERAGAAIPDDFAALCGVVEECEGALFRDLVDALAGGQVTGDEILQALRGPLFDSPKEPES